MRASSGSWAVVASLVVLSALSVMPAARATVSDGQPPMPPLPPGELFAPAGAMLDGGAVGVPVARVAQTSQVVPVQDRPRDGESSERQRQEKEAQQRKDKDAVSKACEDQAKDCREALKELRDDRIDKIGLDIRVGGRPGSDYPCECRLEGETFQPRRFATTMMTWKAAGYCHKPLYFEDWNLERYGHSYGPLDPVFSAAHFFVTLPVLPYKMGVELPWECVYPLGYYRPGNCAPWTVPAPPISCRGFAVEAATVTGLVFLLP